MDEETQTIFTLVLAVLAVLAFRFLPRIMAGVPFLDAGEVKRKLDSGEVEVVVDVRTPNEYGMKDGHIPGAVNLPFGDIAIRLKSLGEDLAPFKELPVIVTCASEQRASHAVRALKKAGFTKLSVLKGGMRAWKRAGLPLEKGIPETFVADDIESDGNEETKGVQDSDVVAGASETTEPESTTVVESDRDTPSSESLSEVEPEPKREAESGAESASQAEAESVAEPGEDTERQSKA